MNRRPFRAIRNTGGMETTSERQPGRRTSTRNNRIGVRKATAKVTGRACRLLTNAPLAASQYIAPNHVRALKSRITFLGFMFTLQFDKIRRAKAPPGGSGAAT